MVTLLLDLEAQAAIQNPNVYSLQSIGDSYQGNPVYAVKFSDNLNRTFPVGFGYNDDCSARGGYDYGGLVPFMLHEGRLLKQFIHNHMVSFVYHQHTPIASAFSKGEPLSRYILNEVIRIYYEGGLPHPKLHL